MATQDIGPLTKEQIKQLTEISKKIEGKKLTEIFKNSEPPEETFNWNNGGILPEPDETIYGPVKTQDWKIQTDNFMSKIEDKAIEDFMKENFPGLTVEQVVEICKDKFPENYV